MLPPARVRQALEQARAAGVEFDDAWPAALGKLTARGRARAEWRRALEETRPAWEAAYTGAASAPAWADILEDALEAAA